MARLGRRISTAPLLSRQLEEVRLLVRACPSIVKCLGRPPEPVAFLNGGKRQPITTGRGSGLKFQGSRSAMLVMEWPLARRVRTEAI